MLRSDGDLIKDLRLQEVAATSAARRQSRCAWPRTAIDELVGLAGDKRPLFNRTPLRDRAAEQARSGQALSHFLYRNVGPYLLIHVSIGAYQ
jgi:hypothetical protein